MCKHERQALGGLEVRRSGAQQDRMTDCQAVRRCSSTVWLLAAGRGGIVRVACARGGGRPAERRAQSADPGRGTVHAGAGMLHPNKFEGAETDDVKDVGRAAWRGRPGAGRAPPAGLPDRSRETAWTGAKR